MSTLQHAAYSVDVVLCVDATESMESMLESVKSRALNFPYDVRRAFEAHEGREISRLRVRVVAFRDVTHDAVPFQVSDFFTLPAQLLEYQTFVGGIVAEGGGDEPDSGLEALAIALNSDWAADMGKQRHVVVLLTDATAHRLEDGAGRVPARYADTMPRNLDELTEWWEGYRPKRIRLRQLAKRLVLFAPEGYPWSDVSLDWNECVHHISKAGGGLTDHQFPEVVDSLCDRV